MACSVSHFILNTSKVISHSIYIQVNVIHWDSENFFLLVLLLTYNLRSQFPRYVSFHLLPGDLEIIFFLELTKQYKINESLA